VFYQVLEDLDTQAQLHQPRRSQSPPLQDHPHLLPLHAALGAGL